MNLGVRVKSELSPERLGVMSIVDDVTFDGALQFPNLEGDAQEVDGLAVL